MSSIEKEDKDQELRTLQYAWKANYTSRIKHKQNSCWAKHANTTQTLSERTQSKGRDDTD